MMDFRSVTRLLVFVTTMVLSVVTSASSIKVQVNDQGDNAHIEFSGLSQWVYEMNRQEGKSQPVVELLLPKLPSDSVGRLKEFSNAQIKKVEVESNKADGKDLVRFHLTKSNIEAFDYLTDQPSRLIVDFFPETPSKVASTPKVESSSPTPPQQKAPASLLEIKPEPSLPSKPLEISSVGSRKPSSTDVLIIKPEPLEQLESSLAAPKNIASYNLFDGGDPTYERFLMPVEQMRDDAHLRALENEYIDFPAIEVPLLPWLRVEANRPLYEVVPKDTEENKKMRLLHTLYTKGRHRVFERTYGWFKQKYPESEYLELATYMLADLKVKRWREEGRFRDFDEAVQLYQALLSGYPQSPLAERTSLMIPFLYQEKKDDFNALRAFQRHISNKQFEADKGFSKDVAKLGQALSYVRLREFQQALQNLEEVEKKSRHAALREDAAYRRGDVFFSSKNYKEAIASYQRALREYKHRLTDYPNSHFNQAESFFKTAQYKDALFTHVDFLKNYPVQDFTPYVMTRVAELLQVLGARPEKVNGALMETAFRFGESPKTLVARIRLLTQRMTSMKPKDVETAIQQVFELAKKSDLNNVEQFSTLLIADGLNDRKDFNRAIQLLTNYYQQNPTGVDQDKFRRKIAKNAVDEINHHIEKGDFLKTLKMHQQYADNWLKGTDRLDLNYDLGRAYELAGVYDKSSKLYQNILNELLSIEGTEKEKKKSVVERLPKKEKVQLRLAQVENEKKNYQKAWETLRLIRKTENLTPKEQVERVQLAADLLIQKGDQETAKKYLVDLIEHWGGKTELIAEPSLKLAALEKGQKQLDASLETLKKLDTKLEESGLSPSDFQSRALQGIIELYSQQDKEIEAVPYYEKLLNLYEDKMPLSSLRYKFGHAYFKKGEMQKASEIWSKLDKDKTGFWKKLANEKLQGADFEGNYKKYIQRIPAMVKEQKEVSE